LSRRLEATKGNGRVRPGMVFLEARYRRHEDLHADSRDDAAELLLIFRRKLIVNSSRVNRTIYEKPNHRSGDCRRFCVGRSTEAQHRSTSHMAVAAMPSTPIICGLQNSIEFNNRRNLVRDQGVGGSNPLSPTNLFFDLLEVPPAKVSCYHLPWHPPLQRKQRWGSLS